MQVLIPDVWWFSEGMPCHPTIHGATDKVRALAQRNDADENPTVCASCAADLRARLRLLADLQASGAPLPPRRGT